MPFVNIQLREGRTVDQKREMVKEVTKALVKTVGCSEEAVLICIQDLKVEDIGKAGRLPFVDS